MMVKIKLYISSQNASVIGQSCRLSDAVLNSRCKSVPGMSCNQQKKTFEYNRYKSS